jgi:hypothetical protein
MCLFCLLHAAVSASRGQPCFFRRHATAFEVVGEEGEVRCDFTRKILFGALISNETAELGEDSSPTRHGYCSSASNFSTTPAIWRQRSVSSLSAFSPALVMV